MTFKKSNITVIKLRCFSFTNACIVITLPRPHSLKSAKNSAQRVILTQQSYRVYYTFVSSQERPWRHWSRPRIHAARRILYASILVFLFEHVRKHTSCVQDNNRLLPAYAPTSHLFLRRDKVYNGVLIATLFIKQLC